MPSFKVKHVADSHYPNGGYAKYHDGKAYETVISYCLNPEKASFVGGFGVNLTQAAYEMERVAQAFGNEDGLHLRHWILSFRQDEFGGRKKIDHILQRIAWSAASYYASQYQIIYAVHRDTHNPHIHFVMSTTNFVTGGKYPGTKEDYYAYQRYLKDVLFPYGMYLTPVADR